MCRGMPWIFFFFLFNFFVFKGEKSFSAVLLSIAMHKSKEFASLFSIVMTFVLFRLLLY